MKCGFPHIYGHLQEEYVLETFDKKFGLGTPPPLPPYPCTDKNKIFAIPKSIERLPLEVTVAPCTLSSYDDK